MRAGNLRHRVVIQSYSASPGGVFNSPQPAWSTVTTVWGRVTPLSGSEPVYASMVSPETTHEIEIRWYSGLTTKHRLQHDSRNFNIESIVDRDERRVTMICLCKELT